MRKTEFWVQLHRNEIASLQVALTSYLKTRFNTSTLSEQQLKDFGDMQEDMKYMQLQFEDVLKMENEDLGKPLT